jgi:prevent-host-death family protein
MIENILAGKSVSVTDLKRNYPSILEASEGEAIAVLNHNKPEAYLLPASAYESLLDRLEDLEDSLRVAERGNGPFEPVAIDDL